MILDPQSKPGPDDVTPEEERRRVAKDRDELERTQRKTIGVLALLALAVVAWIASPVAVGILLGTLMAFTMQPLYERWKTRMRPSIAAVATVAAAAIGLVVAFGGLGWLFVDKGSALAKQGIDAINDAGGVNAVAKVGHVTRRFGLPPEHIQERLRSAAGAAAERAASTAETILAATAATLLALFFAILTMHFILRNWEKLLAEAQDAMPIRPDYTVALFEEFRSVGRSTLLGTIVTGFAQGLLATIGYWICGVPQPVFFGALTAVASLIPAVGTLLVWVPAGVVLILTQHSGAGIGLLVWGMLLIVGASDYIIRPRLVGGDSEMPALITFTALFGGAEVFGLKGLIVGPVLMALGIAVLRIYTREMRERRQQHASLRRIDVAK
ncbi:MAG TPA: AI-2E family transporter [Polyangiaceae bacterium]